MAKVEQDFVYIDKNKRIVVCIFCLILSVIITLLSFKILLSDTPYERKFQPHLEEFAALASSVQSTEPPYIRGKVITITLPDSTVVNWAGTSEIWEYEVDTLLYKLPGEWKPHEPEDVATIILLKWVPQKVGWYIQGGAFVQTCTVTVIDRTIPAVLDSREFIGDPPPERGNAESYGSSPAQKIVDYLVSLPRK